MRTPDESHIRHLHALLCAGTPWQESPHHAPVEQVLHAFAGQYMPTDPAPEPPLSVAAARFFADHYDLMVKIVSAWRFAKADDRDLALTAALEKLTTLARRSEGRDHTNPAGLVRVATRRAVMDYLNSSRRVQTYELTEVNAAHAATLPDDDGAVARATVTRLVRAAGLSPQQARALELRFVRDRPVSEIAAELGVDEPAVEQLLADTLGQLRETAARVLPDGVDAGLWAASGTESAPEVTATDDSVTSRGATSSSRPRRSAAGKSSVGGNPSRRNPPRPGVGR